MLSRPKKTRYKKRKQTRKGEVKNKQENRSRTPKASPLSLVKVAPEVGRSNSPQN